MEFKFEFKLRGKFSTFLNVEGNQPFKCCIYDNFNEYDLEKNEN